MFYDLAVKYLSERFVEYSPFDFYRFMFPADDLEVRGQEKQGDFYKYNPILIEEVPTGRKDEKGKDIFKYVRKHVFSDLREIEEAARSDNFITLNPVTYIGRERTSENARHLYALAIDLDQVETEHHIIDLFHQMFKAKYIPVASFVAVSGNGLHIYYFFENPIKCFSSTIFQLNALKNGLTRKIWNQYTTDLYKADQVQYQPPLQPFRMVGSVTKDFKKTGHRVRVFKVGDKVTLDYLNSFVNQNIRADRKISYKTLSLEEAKIKYPKWFENRVVKGLPKGQWVCKRDLYDWWLNQIKEKAKEGHRYWDIMLLASYARKAGITFEELQNDAFRLVDPFDELTEFEENHFTSADVAKALQAYKRPKTVYMSIDAIEHYSAIRIEKNKRNGRKQADHLKLARYVRDEINQHKDTWRNKDGRPSRQAQVQEWRKEHPDGKKVDCQRETGLSKHTVLKWW